MSANMKLVRCCAAIALVLVLAFAGALRFADPAPAADGDAPPSLLGVNVAKGYVLMGMLAPPNSQVTFFEQLPSGPVELGRAVTLTPPSGKGDGLASIPAIPWVCGRPIRHFTAEAHTSDGRTITAANDARTPDCRDRIVVRAPARVEPGSQLRITLKDRWLIGDLPMRLCLVRHGGRSCTRVKLDKGQTSVSVTRPAGSAVAVLDIDLVAGGFHRHQKVGVGRAAPVSAKRPVALVTGDSMMEGIDSILAQQLKKRYRVIGQVRPGTGVSKELGKPWTTLAREQASKQKPALTVVLLGGNDGFPMTTASGAKVECCGEPWRAEYLARLTRMATAYLRDGRGTLVWSLLPPPKRSDLVAQMAAVNDVIRRLGAAMPTVQLVALDKLFGPEYRDTVNGQKVRDPDGLHLSLPGQRMAAKAIIAAIRAAGA